MLEVINELSQAPFGIVVIELMILVIILFFLWFCFFVVGLPLGALISAIKLMNGKPCESEEKEKTDHESSIDSGLSTSIRKKSGISTSQESKKREEESELGLRA